MDNSIPDFERKYEDLPEHDFPTWIISPDGNCDFQGRVPKSGENIRINLLEEKSHLPRAGNFCAQEENGEIILFEMVEERRHKILFRWGPKDIFNDVWDRHFQDHENVGLIDDMIKSWKENEEYVDLNFNDRMNGSTRNRNSREIRRIVRRKRICAVKDKFYVAKGPIQGCKSQYMIDGALKCLRNGKSSIIIFQETGHLIQFKERLEQEFNLISTKIQESGKQCFPLVCVVVKNENFSSDEFLKSLQGHPAKIFLIIGNDKQAGLLNEKFKKASKLAKSEIIESYVLWVDEADHVDSGTKAKKTWSLSAMKKYAYAIVEVSATVLDITAREDVKKQHLSILRAPRSYRGIPSFTIIETTEKAKYASKVSSNLLRTDKALKRIIEVFVNDEVPIRCPVQNDSHPCIMLINNGRTIEPQKRLMIDLKRKYSDLTLIVYIGEGIFIHHDSFPKTSFEISKVKSSLTNYGHLFKGVSPSSALLWLKQNGGVRCFHHILIISGNLAGRSISYGCKDPGSEGLKYWHLTHHRLILPKNSSCPEVIQKCRLCTIFETPVPLKLYVNKKDELAVIKSHWSQEEIIERSKATPDETYLKEIMQRLELLGGKNGKIPVGRTLTVDGKLKVCKRVKGDDGGLSISAYKFDGLLDRERDSFSEKMRKSEVERKDLDRNAEYAITMEISNLEKNVRTALDHNNDTIVLRILRHFKNLDLDAIISLQTLQALGATNITHYTQWTRDGTSKGQYKLLINHHTGYGLNPQIQHLLAIV